MSSIKQKENQFFIGDDFQNPLAEITFKPAGKNTIIINYTYVCNELKGQGIALQLVEKVVEHARQENKKIVPLCSYAQKVLTQNENYKDVLNNN